MSPIAGVVLAAGLGTRLRPLTELRPKAMCPVGGRPLLEHALDRLTEHLGGGPGVLAVNAHHLPDQVVAGAAGRAHLSIEHSELLGTAGALGRLREWIDHRHVLLTNADAYLTGGLDLLLDGADGDGWDGERCRLLCLRRPGTGDFGELRYVGACLLPARLVRGLEPVPSALNEVLWRREHERGALELVELDESTGATALDCGTPADYLRANLHASGGDSVVGAGAVVDGELVRSVVWDGAYVGPGERLVEQVRAGTRHDPVTVGASL